MKNKLVLLAMALVFSLIFINCGENPEEKSNQESTVIYKGGSGATETIITIMTAANGTKTYVIMYDGAEISSGSVVINDDGTMTFTPEGGGDTFIAETSGDGAVPSFGEEEIPTDSGGTIPIPPLEEQVENPFKGIWGASDGRWIIFDDATWENTTASGDHTRKGTYTYNGNSGVMTITHKNDGDGAEYYPLTSESPDSTMSISGNTLIITEVGTFTKSFAVVAMQVYLFDSVGNGQGDGKTHGGSYNVPYKGSDGEVTAEINKVSITVGTITGGKISVTLTSLEDSQLDTPEKILPWLTTTTSGLKVGNLELRPSEDDHYFGLTHPITMARIMYFNKDGNITVEGKTLQVKRGWNFLTLTDIEISQNIQDVYNKGYRWIYYNINHND